MNFLKQIWSWGILANPNREPTSSNDNSTKNGNVGDKRFQSPSDRFVISDKVDEFCQIVDELTDGGLMKGQRTKL